MARLLIVFLLIIQFVLWLAAVPLVMLIELIHGEVKRLVGKND